jgi:hypothetical protein
VKMPTPQRLLNSDKTNPPGDRPHRPRPAADNDPAAESALPNLALAHDRLTAVIGDLSGALVKMAPRVIGVQTVVLDANGTAAGQYRLPYQSLFVDSFSASLLTIASMPLQSAAPNAGPGVALIRPGGAAVVNLRSYLWSVYGGTPGERVTVTAYANPQPPTAMPGDHSSPSYTVAPAQPVLGASLNYTLATPARLVAFTAVYTAGAAAGNRFPPVNIISPTGLTQAEVSTTSGIAPSTTATIYTAIGEQTSINAQFGTYIPLPDLGVLPVGTIVNIPIGNAGDQISAVVLTFQASV